MQTSKNVVLTKFDTVNNQLNSKSELLTLDLVDLKIIDTSVTTQLGQTCYCDTTVQLNDSVYYSIISVGDNAGVCSYIFLASINNKNKKVVASKYLHPDCDVDYSWDTYELYEHKVISKNNVEVIETTIFQKKNRISADEEQNIDHKQIKKGVVSISQIGQINTVK